MENKPLRIYVAAAKQNDGKTTAALGLMNVIRESYPKIGYIKPVGQHFNVINSKKIDKDASLIEDVFHIGTGLQDMSPVAKLLNSPVIIVASGGIGRPIDEIMLNKALFDSYGVEVLGVIINKVKPEKFEKINKVVRLGLDRLGISVLGVTPFFPILTSPNLQQVLEDMQGTLISGEKFLDHTISKFLVGAMPPSTAAQRINNMIIKIKPHEVEKIKVVKSMIKEYVDVRMLFEKLGAVTS
ncbi:MAG TPA: hypothetical protein ENI06_09130 [Spirochaetales bacterium]|nr:hypothetical protein [Spirochaetales bacterium]